MLVFRLLLGFFIVFWEFKNGGKRRPSILFGKFNLQEKREEMSKATEKF